MVRSRSLNEISKIARSCQIVADTLIMLEPFVKPGAKVSDLDKIAKELRLVEFIQNSSTSEIIKEITKRY